MNFSTFVQRTRALGSLDVSGTDIDAVAERLERRESLETVLDYAGDRLSPYLCLNIWRAYKTHRQHLDYLESVARRRHEEKRAPIPSSLLKHSLTEHEVGVIERADALAPVGSVPEHRRRDAIKSVVALWYSCLAVMRSQAALKVVLLTQTARLANRFRSFVGNHQLSEISNQDWLSIRRGERLGILELVFELPLEALCKQVNSRAANLSAIAGGREAEAFLEVVVLPDLEQWSLRLKDKAAELTAQRSACVKYMELISSAPPNLPILAAVYVPPTGPMGVAIVLRDGRLVGEGSIDLEGGIATELESIIGSHPVEALVLPSHGVRKSVQEIFSTHFTNIKKIEVTTKGLSQASAALPGELSPSVRGALALARRVLDPYNAWMKVNPLALELADHQQEIEQDGLNSAYMDVQVLAKRGWKVDALSPSKGAEPKSSKTASKPLVKSLNDLKPGMELNGTISRLANFGAFVNLGLSCEGLVHISEISDQFVDDPKSMLRVGQPVRATILGVDGARQRISLTLRKNRKIDSASSAPVKPRTSQALGELLGQHPSQKPKHQESSPAARNQGSVSRAQALADLEALFSKK